ncbi:hypothetical protein AVEN_139288-1 [Araneus ventricosus]|uniref:Uncharacterized protein n=1 Tax=Araneus ventricosus TaxID=182803 RepID=A0A4Y2DQN9_ARAVE|nr:hypothetical protein AVEN_139288-1 [Araneus ventricosus]
MLRMTQCVVKHSWLTLMRFNYNMKTHDGAAMLPSTNTKKIQSTSGNSEREKSGGVAKVYQRFNSIGGGGRSNMWMRNRRVIKRDLALLVATILVVWPPLGPISDDGSCLYNGGGT